jgi:serine/threonine protein kinase
VVLLLTENILTVVLLPTEIILTVVLLLTEVILAILTFLIGILRVPFRNRGATPVEVEKESTFLSQLAHAQVVRFFGVCFHGTHAFLVTELCELSLQALISQTQGAGLDNITAVDIGQQVCTGMEYLLDMGIMHRDLKPANILLNKVPLAGSSTTAPRYQYQVKLIDFGLARTITAVNTALTMTATLGTPAFMAPELVSDSSVTRYSTKTDVYSFGICLWCMCTGDNTPYSDQNVPNVFALAAEVLRGLRPVMPPYSPLKSLTERCWHNDPNVRPGFPELAIEFTELSHTVVVDIADVEGASSGKRSSVVVIGRVPSDNATTKPKPRGGSI